MATIVYLDVEDEITSAAARIRAAADTRVGLVLPFGSRVATSRINFRLLAREAMSHGRRLDIVAPDASARALAASAGLPVFGRSGEYEEALDTEDDEKDARRAEARAAAGIAGGGRDRRGPRRPPAHGAAGHAAEPAGRRRRERHADPDASAGAAAPVTARPPSRAPDPRRRLADRPAATPGAHPGRQEQAAPRGRRRPAASGCSWSSSWWAPSPRSRATCCCPRHRSP